MKQLSRTKKINAFTLVELLIVIAIIAVLAVVVGANYNSAKKQSRDAKRQQDVDSLVNAMKMFYDDGRNRYPECTSDSPQNGCAIVSGTADGYMKAADYNALREYINYIPDDPYPVVAGTYSENGTKVEYQKYRYVNQPPTVRGDDLRGFGILVLFENPNTKGCNDNWQSVYDSSGTTNRCACKLGANVLMSWWGNAGNRLVPLCN